LLLLRWPLLLLLLLGFICGLGRCGCRSRCCLCQQSLLLLLLA
jgi:hypothetical protein